MLRQHLGKCRSSLSTRIVNLSRRAVHGSRFTVHGSQFTVHGSRFTVRGSRFAVRGSRFAVASRGILLRRSLEGSRFTRWQLYRLAAGGSRERLDGRQFYGPLYPRNRTDAMGKTLRCVIRGSRLLPTDRAAILYSGLPDVASRSFRRRGEVWLPSRPWACDAGFLRRTKIKRPLTPVYLSPTDSDR